ncbi:hypothetical protein J7E79_22360 [Bacillus sp. ISL-40]|uniref:FIMAH domain-containing protein n=1 Tax=unclassified Bacillus (in: firmicutes) TaxID=185979 RepID=UPI001BEA001B|nr:MULTISPECIES: hypothetical protein [unclassified Bacillus (in: firmicutes)]MBT2700116.1 hypothetical protein [Bacillus sp. ISL-40]MBT2741228.1 hypothetical protein [Bacillus sp. ISL-77]
MAELRKNKELTDPLFSQLDNSLKQVKHHLEKESVQKALEFMEKFMAEINKKNNETYLSSEGKLNLTHNAQLFMNMLEKE